MTEPEAFDPTRRAEHASNLVFSRLSEGQAGSPLLNKIKELREEPVSSETVFRTPSFEDLDGFLDEVLRRDCLPIRRQSVRENIEQTLCLTDRQTHQWLILTRAQVQEVARILTESDVPLQAEESRDSTPELLARGNLIRILPLRFIMNEPSEREMWVNVPKLKISVQSESGATTGRVKFDDPAQLRYLVGSRFTVRNADGNKLAEARLLSDGVLAFGIIPAKPDEELFLQIEAYV
ncbi:MAG: hypothetical protein PHI23_05265 [Candidatus Peribacteraceae bacterium]|nr:hypothetical protein [Candidatus Peribacteraceae bacterium]